MEKIKDYIRENKLGIILSIVYFVVSVLGQYLLREVFVLLHNGDTEDYTLLAGNLLEHHMFSVNGVKKYYMRPPGYPFILAAFYIMGGDDSTVVVFQYFLGSLILFLTYRIAKIVDANKTVTLITLIIAFFNVEGFLHHGLVLSESTYIFSVVLGLFFWIKYLFENKKIFYIVFFSLCMAAAVLIRPIIRPFLLVLALIFVILVFTKVISFKSLLVYILIMSVTIGGWCYRNMQITGTFKYDYRVQLDLYRVLARNVENYRIGYAEPDPSFTNGIEHVQPYLDKYISPEEIEALGKEDYRVAAYCEKAAKDYLSEHVADTIKLCVRSTMTILFGPFNDFWHCIFKENTASVFARAYMMLLAFTYLLYIVGVIINRKKLSLSDLSVFGYILYMVVVSSTNFGSRYRLGFIYIIYIAIICAFKNKKELSNGNERIEGEA